MNEGPKERLVARVHPDKPKHVERMGSLCRQVLGFNFSRQHSAGDLEFQLAVRLRGEWPRLQVHLASLRRTQRRDDDRGAEKGRSNDNPQNPT